jgi:hopanoid biosynthesis associated RND transporter like protein HpnN
VEGSRLIHRFLFRVQEAALEFPGRVLAASVLLLVVAAALGSGVEFRTSRSDLAPADDPDQIRLDEVAAEFTGTSDLVACVEAAPGSSRNPEDLRAFADRLAERFRAEPEVAQVFHKIDLDRFLERGLYFVPPATIREGLDALEAGSLGSLASVRDITALNEAVASRLEADFTGSVPSEESARKGIESLAELLEWERRFLEEPSELVAWLEEEPPLLRLAGERTELKSGGYLQTHDGATLFLMVSPRSDDDSLPYLRRFVGRLREAAGEILPSDQGFHVAFTGEPAMTVEEMRRIRIDTWTTSAVASIGVILLTFFVFRWRTHALLALSALAFGVVWALGAVRLELGYLNLITSSFISTLIGVGVAYAIHPVSEYELQGAHTGNPVDAVRAAYRATGAAVTTGAVTTAGAFFAILFMRFRGFSELGLVAGVGILLCLLSALVTLPAILAIYGRWRNAHDRSVRNAAPVVDRIWVERGVDHVCSHPKITTAVAVLVTAALAWAGSGVRFDTSLINLLPRDAESVRYLQRMIDDSDLSPNFNILLTDSIDELREMRARAAAEPTIARFDSVLSFLPEDPEGSQAVMGRIEEVLDEVNLPAEPRPLDRKDLLASLGRLENALSNAADAAFGSGLAGLAGPLEHARVNVESLETFVENAPQSMEADWNEGQKRLLEWMALLLEDLRIASRAEPPDLDDLPGEVRDRFMTRSGRYVGLLYSTESIFDDDFLDEFVTASRRVSTEVTGFPILFDIMSERIVSGFYRAASIASVVVLFILLIDLRSTRDALFALVPLAMGLMSMMGGMRLLGIPYNFANLVAVPLIIGVGIDNGVHIIHRLRLEGDRGMTVVLRHTGRAILIASLTTMIGFGSLSLASHRGVASLGAILILGVGSCLVASMIVLPNILIVLGRARR